MIVEAAEFTFGTVFAIGIAGAREAEKEASND